MTVSEVPSGQASIAFDESMGHIEQCEISSREGTGVSLFMSSEVSIQDSTVKGNQGYGLNAQNEATIACTGSTEVSGNAKGQTLGNVEGCN